MRIIALPTGHVDVKYINDNCLNEEYCKKPLFYTEIGASEVREMRKVRTKEELIQDIQVLANDNRKFLSCKYLSKNGRSDLLYAAKKHFGSWNKAVIASGETPLNSRWCKERVISELQRISLQTGKTPNYGALKKRGNYGLAQAARKYWGSWARALLEIKLRPLRNDFWTKETLIEELKNVVSTIGYVPSKRELNRLERNDLVSSGSKFFNGYNHYLIAAGFEPVLIPNIWTKEKLIFEIITLYRELKRTPTERDMVAWGKGTVVTATIRQFKTWNKAVRAAGLVPNESFVKNKIWKRWESFVLRLCGDLYPDAEAHKVLPNKSIPDLYEYTNNLIIEVKTNASDTTIYKDILNYGPYCNKIEIWHLGGIPINTSSKKVTFRGPNYVWNIVKSNKEVSKEFNDIRNAFTQAQTKKAQHVLQRRYNNYEVKT